MPLFRSLNRLLKRKELPHSRVLVRVDLNVPIDKNGYIGWAESYRIESIVDTVNAIRNAGATVILLSHRGRPQGKIDESYSLLPCCIPLEKALSCPIEFLADPFSQESKKKIITAYPQQVFLLENLRFYPGEEENDIHFSRELAKYGDWFVNEAFAVSHRNVASVTGLARLLPAYAGVTLAREIKILSRVITQPKKPFIAIVGGAKISTKIGVIKKLLKHADEIWLTGGLANTCLASSGQRIGGSITEQSAYDEARSLIKNKKIRLPEDYIVTESIKKKPLPFSPTNVREPNDIRPREWIGDIGPNTLLSMKNSLKNAGTVVWNGPVGYMEDARFAKGTNQLISLLTRSRANVVVGGGETVQAWRLVHHTPTMWKSLSHITLSTGGGAMLEFIEKGTLIGIKVLSN